jgi:ADP-ribosyl-[dinitrogen reductase] hydrolase
VNDQRHALDVAVAAARVAGARLLAEFLSPEGPRGGRGKAPADVEVEAYLRTTLQAAFPDDGFRAEESPDQNHTGTSGFTWLVDPNDGTAAFLRGQRGASVSIARLFGGVPVLGVVFAYAAPDNDGDLIAWAEGCGTIERNGRPVPHPGWPTTLGPYDVVLVSDAADRRALPNARCVAPARYRPVPGIAYRLALVAVGEAVAASSLFSPRDFDYAAGHALLRGVGGELVDERGRPVRYHDQPSRLGFCFGGAPALLPDLVGREYNALLRMPEAPIEPGDPVASAVFACESAVLARAQGCWSGQLVGDALGSQVEFESPAQITSKWPDGVRSIRDGGTFNTLAGQPTDDSELALALARSLVATGAYDADVVASAYGRWVTSGPFDMGHATRQALSGAVRLPHAPADGARVAASAETQANGALMRISPLAIAGTFWDPADLVRAARVDATLTHPHIVCQDANVVFCLAIAYAIRTGAPPAQVYAHAVEQASALGLHADIQATLADAAQGPPPDCMHQMGWVRIALRNAFYQLCTAPSFEAGLVDTVGRGGDTDTNGCIAGALLGAVFGREGIPLAWRQRGLTCRPIEGLPGVHRPRPKTYWPIDALVLPERLLAVTP